MELLRITAALGLSAVITGHVSARGILGKQAPSWGVTEWKNLPEGKKQLDLKDFKGKVVYLYCFQSWCPGCHKYGFPTLKKAISNFKGDKGVAFVAVQTVFEGASVNTPARAWSTARKYDLKIPVGHSGDEKNSPPLMRNYRTGGTPWTIIIDRKGKVRYNDFHIQPTAAIKLIEGLLKE